MPDPIIAVEHLNKSVTDSTGTLAILRDIDFSLAPKETAAIVGASGSGKSTLLSIIAGLDTPTTGTVRLAGQDIFAIGEDERAALRARQVGFVFQSFQLLGNLTALENVMLPLELAGRNDSRKAATEMMSRVGLSTRVNEGVWVVACQRGRPANRVPSRVAAMALTMVLVLTSVFNGSAAGVAAKLRAGRAKASSATPFINVRACIVCISFLLGLLRRRGGSNQSALFYNGIGTIFVSNDICALEFFSRGSGHAVATLPACRRSGFAVAC